MEFPKDESIDDAVKHRRRTTKEESIEQVTTVEDAVSGVDDQTKKQLTRDDIILGILKTQANQIQALTAIVAQHGRVLELLTSVNVHVASCHTGTLPSEAPTRQKCPRPKPNDVVQCMSAPPATRMGRVNKGATDTHPPASQVNLKGKLSFKDEGKSSHELIRNIRPIGPGSPWTFYTHKSADIRSEETPKCLDLSFWSPPGMLFVGHELAVAAYIFANGLQPSEILVENDHYTRNREALWTLRPGEVVDDVIDLVMAMVSSNKAEKTKVVASYHVCANSDEPWMSLQVNPGLYHC
ncbi:hypothetical protein HN51_039945 [Arachis hypogaea]